MSKNVLEQYVFIKKEIADLERRIAEGNRKIRHLEKEIVCDTVTGSRDDLTIGTIKISGIANEKIEKQWELIRKYTASVQTFKESLGCLIVDVEEFIQQIPNSETRYIARLRFTDGMEWRDIAKCMGPGYTEDGCRKKFNRYMKKCEV